MAIEKIKQIEAICEHYDDKANSDRVPAGFLAGLILGILDGTFIFEPVTGEVKLANQSKGTSIICIGNFTCV